MTTWYLIIILFAGSGNSQQHLEFKNQAACVSVRNELLLKYESKYNYIDCKEDR